MGFLLMGGDSGAASAELGDPFCGTDVASEKIPPYDDTVAPEIHLRPIQMVECFADSAESAAFALLDKLSICKSKFE